MPMNANILFPWPTSKMSTMKAQKRLVVKRLITVSHT